MKTFPDNFDQEVRYLIRNTLKYFEILRNMINFVSRNVLIKNRFRFGIVDARIPTVSNEISKLLNGSIEDARESKGGHLPDHLVETVKRNYITPEKVSSLWEPFGYRFAMTDHSQQEIIGTMHVSKHHDNIFTINRNVNNVSSKEHPGFKPDLFHQVVNLSVKHKYRRLGIATEMMNEVCSSFSSFFDGTGLWFRADPPWHDPLLRMSFAHSPEEDTFSRPEAERTRNLPHDQYNALWQCNCRGHNNPNYLALLENRKIKYVFMSRRFDMITDLTDQSVTVRADTTWLQLINYLFYRFKEGNLLLPPVLTAWLPATIGGTLMTQGHGKGSHQYGLQTDQILRLIGQKSDGEHFEYKPRIPQFSENKIGEFSFQKIPLKLQICSVTIPLIPTPRRVSKFKVINIPFQKLAEELKRSIFLENVFHVTAYHSSGNSEWTINLTFPSKDPKAMDIQSYLLGTSKETKKRKASRSMYLVSYEELEKVIECNFPETEEMQIIPIKRGPTISFMIHLF